MKKISEDMKDKFKSTVDVKVDLDAVKPDKEEEIGISADNLFKVISREWVGEIKKIRHKTTQCQVKKKRDSVFDTKVQSGHAEIEGDNLLFI